jgi:hypothetical protein
MKRKRNRRPNKHDLRHSVPCKVIDLRVGDWVQYIDRETRQWIDGELVAVTLLGDCCVLHVQPEDGSPKLVSRLKHATVQLVRMGK